MKLARPPGLVRSGAGAEAVSASAFSEAEWVRMGDVTPEAFFFSTRPS